MRSWIYGTTSDIYRDIPCEAGCAARQTTRDTGQILKQAREAQEWSNGVMKQEVKNASEAIAKLEEKLASVEKKLDLDLD